MSATDVTEIIRPLDEAVAKLTQPGEAFEIKKAVLRGHEYPVYASIPNNLGEYFEFMRKHGDAEFLVYLDQRIGYTEALELALGFAAKLSEQGVQKGDRIAIV